MDVDKLWSICKDDMMWIREDNHIILETKMKVLLTNEAPEYTFPDDYKERTNLTTMAQYRSERYLCGSKTVVWKFTFCVRERQDVFRHVFLALTVNPEAVNKDANEREWHNMPVPKVFCDMRKRITIQIPEPLEEIRVGTEDGVVKQTCIPKWYLTTMLVDEGHSTQCTCGKWRMRFKKCPSCTLEFCSSGCGEYRTHWLDTHSRCAESVETWVGPTRSKDDPEPPVLY